MTKHVITKDRNTQLVIRDSRGIWTLNEDTMLHVYGKPGILISAQARNATVNIEGDVLTAGVGKSMNSLGDLPFTLLSKANNTTVNIGANAEIISPLYAFYLTGTNAVVNNAGHINSSGAIAMMHEGRVTNSGSIAGNILMDGGTFINQEGGVVIGAKAVSGGDSVLHIAQTYINKGLLGGMFAIDDADSDSKTINTGTIEGTVSLGGGKDVFDTRGGIVRGKVEGGEGNDTFIVSRQVTIVEHTGEGTDTVKSSATFVLGSSSEVERLILSGKDNINGTGSATDNQITGNSGNNLLRGLAGADVLTGGLGNDRLEGGDGADHFVFRKGDGADTILDFDNSVDQIYLKGSGFADFDALSSHITEDKHGNAVIALNQHDSIVLTGVDSGVLNDSDFVFSA